MEQLRKTYYKLTLQFLYPPAWIATSTYYKKLPYWMKIYWHPIREWKDNSKVIAGLNKEQLEEMVLLFQQLMEYEAGIPTRIVR